MAKHAVHLLEPRLGKVVRAEEPTVLPDAFLRELPGDRTGRVDLASEDPLDEVPLVLLRTAVQTVVVVVAHVVAFDGPVDVDPDGRVPSQG